MTDCGQELVRNGDHRLPLLFYHRGFIFGNLFVFGKFIVIDNQTLDAFLVLTWWESGLQRAARADHCAAETDPIGLPRIVMPSGSGRPATLKLAATSSARRRR